MTFSVRTDRFRAELETIRIDMETRLDYDATFMRDKLVVTAHTDKREGCSAVALDPGGLEEHGAEAERLVAQILPDMRRKAIDAALELGFAAEISHLGQAVLDQSCEIRDLKEIIAHLRRPWWRKAYDFLADFFEYLVDAIR